MKEKHRFRLPRYPVLILTLIFVLSLLIFFIEQPPLVANAAGWKDYGICRISFYCPCRRCNGRSDRMTASGDYLEDGVTVAAGPDLKLGTEIYIDGIGYRTVQDRGVKNGQIDVFVDAPHNEVHNMGFRYLRVYLIK
jgi:3D (Asp-Asp-Asp) domain-containing protein